MAELREHLTNLRKFAKFTQYGLADKLGKTRGWISQVEQGVLDIRSKDALEWAHACTEHMGPPLNLELVVRQSIKCPKCGEMMYDSPPGSGVFVPCAHFVPRLDKVS